MYNIFLERNDDAFLFVISFDFNVEAVSVIFFAGISDATVALFTSMFTVPVGEGGSNCASADLTLTLSSTNFDCIEEELCLLRFDES